MATNVFEIRWGHPRQTNETASASAFNVDASDEGIANLIQASAAETISAVTVIYGTGAGTPPNYKVSLQGVGTTGLPDGTIKGGASPASKVFAGATSGSAKITLDNTYTCARGEDLMVVIEYESGTVNASNYSRFVYGNNIQRGLRAGRGYVLTKTGGTYTKDAGTSPQLGLIGSTRCFGFPVNSIAYTVNTFSSTNERGLRFKLPSGILTDFDVVGVDPFMSTPTASGLVMVSLYDTDGTTMLQNAEFDTDAFSAAGSAGRLCDLFFNEATLSRLVPGSVYRIGFACSTGTGSVQSITVAANGDLAAFPGGIEWYECNRTIASYPPPTSGGNAWTDTTTTRPAMGIIIESVTPVSGGGGVTRARLPAGLSGVG